MASLENDLRWLLGRADRPAGRAADVLLDALESAVLRDAPSRDPDSARLRQLADQLRNLRGAALVAPTKIPAGERSIAPAPDTAPLTQRWRAEHDRLLDHGGSQAPEGTPALWQGLHLVCLRMAPTNATALREFLAGWAARNGLNTHEADPAPGAEALVPGLFHAGQQVSAGLQARRVGIPPGVRGPLDARTICTELEALADTVLVLADHDPTLFHCLQSIDFAGVRSLTDPSERSAYQDQSRRRLERLGRAPSPSERWLGMVVEVHEAICCVLHLPPAEELTWWGGLRAQANELLRAAARLVDPSLVVFPPERYVHTGRLTRQDIPVPSPDRSGWVLACVRVWSRVDGVERPGRVVYAS